MKGKINRNKFATIPIATDQKLVTKYIPAGNMIMHLNDSLYLFSIFFYRTVIEYQSPDLTAVLRYSV